jgi:serine/threonine protein kinase
VADAEGINAHSYEVLGKLADGGTTEIFLARARGAGAVERFVVLKRLRRSVAGQLDVVKVFLDEAQRASQLQHPNVAQVFEVGKLGGSYFFAMEFVNGETLEALIRHARDRKIQVPVRAVLTIASAMAAGLHHAHERRGTDGQPLGILHGDVSPANTLVSQEGIVKLVDFGLAKAGEQGASTITPYASPEQCSGDALDRRSDLFSLGVVLWELLTLDALRPRGGETEIWQAIETEEPAKPSAKRYDVPPELDAMVLKLLAKDPADRFQDADELLAAIETLAQKLGILLSTADLSRMVRLWFGTKSEPTVDPSSPEAAAPLVVTSEQVPAELAEPSTSPIDEALDAVRSAATLITARATARAGNTTGRQDRPTIPPELMDNPNENFEQIRDRILARARQKKETLRNQIIAAGGTPPDAAAPPVDSAAAPAP